MLHLLSNAQYGIGFPLANFGIVINNMRYRLIFNKCQT